MKLRRTMPVLVALWVLSLVAPVGAQSDSVAGVDGVWRSAGYGYVIDVQDDVLTVYEESAVSCLLWFSMSAAEMGLTLTLEGDQLLITDDVMITISADRLPELPTPCTNGGTTATDDPEFNFEVFWHSFNEQYAFFDLYGVNWQAQYDRYRPQVTATTTSDELFAVLAEMITPLTDGHISLQNETDSFSPGLMPAWGSSVTDLLTVIRQELDLLVYGYLHEDEAYMQEHFTITEEGIRVKSNVIYGSLSDEIGYISLFTMEPTSADLTSVGTAIDEALAALADKQALVVDVRFNGGGLDAVALIYASRFADESRLAYSKHARDGEGFTPSRDYYVIPAGPQQFTRPIVVLTSGLTASAAEIFVMAMRELPHVTVIGEPTSGGHSDMLGRTLPNGWQVTLSNEEYVLASGEVFESVGIPPVLTVSLDPVALAKGHDVMMEAALAYLAQ